MPAVLGRVRLLSLAAVLGTAVVLTVFAPGGGAIGAVDPQLGKALRDGGLVIVLRHAITDQSKQDEDPVDLDDCTTQRNLSAQGRADARAIGRGIRRLHVRVGKVLTSAFCRTRETARLAFSRRGVVSPALLNTVNAEHNAAWRAQIRAARRLLGTRPATGTVTVLVTHGSVVADTTGVALEEGEALVFRPLGNSHFRLIGRILPREWGVLRATTAAAAPRIREYPVPAGSGPHDVAPAADGTVWYTAQASGELGRLNPATGKVTQVPLGSGAAPHGVIIGPDGAPWITDGGLNAVVRVDPDTLAVKRYPLPASAGYSNLNTATFDHRGALWFTGQSGIYGQLNPKTGAMRVFRAPGGPGPYGITTTPRGEVWFASLAGSYVARIDLRSGKAIVLRPPTRNQGARRIWSDSRGRLWVTEWNSGRVARYDPTKRRWREWRLPGSAQPYAIYVDEKDVVWLTDFVANAIVRFAPATGRFTTIRLRAGANVRQLLGRAGEIWGAESGADRLVVVRTSR
jgi:virginiamycin B lyase